MSMLLLTPDEICTPPASLFGINRKFNAQLAASIMEEGLLNPILVEPTKPQGTYRVIDGKKRLMVMAYLAKNDLLPRSLVKVPCIVRASRAQRVHGECPELVSEPELFRLVQRRLHNGVSCEDIAKVYGCARDYIQKIAAIRDLHHKLLNLFMRREISVEQAAAYATLPHPAAQWRLMLQLGPFATTPEILEKIKYGDAVVDMPDGNILILPSRGNLTLQPMKPGMAA